MSLHLKWKWKYLTLEKDAIAPKMQVKVPNIRDEYQVERESESGKWKYLTLEMKTKWQ